MAVELINDHVLFPQRANWAVDPEWSRAWETQVTNGLKGPESRTGLRAVPRVTLKWVPSIKNLQQLAQLDDQVRAALKSGKACCPYWGRASRLSLDCTAAAATLQATPWPWEVNDWIFFLDQDTREFNVRQVTNVAGLVLTLQAAVTRTFRANTLVWPLLFGKLTQATLAAETSRHGAYPIAITENTPAAAIEPVGEYTPPDPNPDLGIPDMEIGTSFIVR